MLIISYRKYVINDSNAISIKIFIKNCVKMWLVNSLNIK